MDVLDGRARCPSRLRRTVKRVPAHGLCSPGEESRTILGMLSEHVIVASTTDSENAARTLAAGVIEARLGACAQIVGSITSLYRPSTCPGWWTRRGQGLGKVARHLLSLVVQ